MQITETTPSQYTIIIDLSATPSNYPRKLSTNAKSSKISKSASKKKPPRSQCVDPNIPEFIIDSNQDIGDVLIHNDGPGFARKCGPDCYLVKDNGDDPPYDPEAGDTLRFAHKKITSYNFSLRARVCGVACDGDGSYFGRTGIMVRDSLDPFARNVFVSHSPNDQADFSYRSATEGETHEDWDGSPDVQCLWITLVRDENTFSASYAYPASLWDDSASHCDVSEIEIDFQNQVSINNMPESVYVGLAVSTPACKEGYCEYTEAEFSDIECRGCRSTCIGLDVQMSFPSFCLNLYERSSCWRHNVDIVDT